jgi:Plant transposon protein
MEVICDLDLWVWSFQLGFPGMFNDLNILAASGHFQRILSGQFPSVMPMYRIAAEEFRWNYYLADGIYPRWNIFLQSIRELTTEKQKQYAMLHEGVRKCMERVFGVLFCRFKITCVKSEFWSAEKMNAIATTCIVLHNMVVEVRRNGCGCDGAGGSSLLFDADADSTVMTLERANEVEAEAHLLRLTRVSDDVQSKSEHESLLSAVTEHLWRRRGEAIS